MIVAGALEIIILDSIQNALLLRIWIECAKKGILTW